MAIKFLLKFQRIIFAELLNSSGECQDPQEEPMLVLLLRYSKLLVGHCGQILQACQSNSVTLPRFMKTMVDVVAGKHTIVGNLLPEFILSCLVLESRGRRSELAALVSPLLDQLDALNGLTPAANKEDADNLSWTGLSSLTCSAKER